MVLQTRKAAASANASKDGVQTRGRTSGRTSGHGNSKASGSASQSQRAKSHLQNEIRASDDDSEVQQSQAKKRKSAASSKEKKGTKSSKIADKMSLAEKMEIFQAMQKQIAAQNEDTQDSMDKEELMDIDDEDEEDDPNLSYPKRQRLDLDDEEEEMSQSLGSIRATSKAKAIFQSKRSKRSPLPLIEDEDAVGFDDLGNSNDDDDEGEEDDDRSEDNIGTELDHYGVFANNGISVEDVEDSLSTSSKKTRSRSTSQTPSRASSVAGASSSHTSAGSKVTEAQFSPRTRPLAIAAKSQVRYQMIFGDMSDATGHGRIDFAWNAIKQAAQKSKSSDTIAAFKRSSNDMVKRKQLITFALYARTNLLSTIITNIRAKVKGSYGLTGSVENIRADVLWLLEDARFMYGGINLQEKSFDATKPFGSELMIEAIEAQWFSSSSKSKADRETTSRIVKEKKIPVSIIMVTLTAIEHALKEWKDGRKSALPFSEDTIKTSINRHLANWTKLEQSTKRWTAYWLKALYEKIVTDDSLLNAASSTDQDLAAVNFTALDQIAGLDEADI